MQKIVIGKGSTGWGVKAPGALMLIPKVACAVSGRRAVSRTAVVEAGRGDGR